VAFTHIRLDEAGLPDKGSFRFLAGTLRAPEISSLRIPTRRCRVPDVLPYTRGL
jgi:hypothetical protein